MRKLLITAALLTTTAASASDLPTKYLPAPLPVWSWSGFYIGGLAGYGFSGSFDNSVSAEGFSVPLNNSASGATAGLYGGYNFMWGNTLLGIETDFSWADIKGGGDFGGKIETVPWAARAENKIGWLGMTRGRVGYAFGRVLPYLAGGVAYGKVETSGVGVLGSSSVNSSFAVPFSGSSNQVGWTLGVGVDYAVTNSIIARAEYLWYDLGTKDWLVPNTVAKVTTDANGNLVRAGISVKW